MKTLLTLLLCLFGLSSMAALPPILRTKWTTNAVPVDGSGLTNVGGLFIVTDYGALGGTNNDTAVFQSLLSIPGATVIIPYRTNGFTVGNLHVTNSVTFVNRGSVLFFATNATGVCVDMHDNTNIVIDGLRIDGQSVSNYEALITANLVLLPNPELYFMQNHYGMDVNMEANRVTGCKVSNFKGAAYTFHNTHGGSSESFNLTDFRGNNALDSMLGFNFNAFTNSLVAEYSRVSDLNASGCTYGIKIGAGNIGVANSTFSGNGVGHLLQGGTNPAHGQFVGCTFNHNKFPIFGEGIIPGEIYIGCIFLANTGPIYLNGVVGFRLESCQLDGPIRMFVTNSVSGVFVPSFNINNCTYGGLWTNNAVTNASNAFFFHANNTSKDLIDTDGPAIFTSINTGDLNPQIMFGNWISNSTSMAAYQISRRNADGMAYLVGAQGATATGLYFQHTRAAGNLGVTYAYFLGDGNSFVATNQARLTITTNEFALNTFYTNVNQRSYVQVTVGLLSGVGGNAQVALYIDQDQNGSFERTGTTEALTGVAASATNSFGAFIQPSGRFVFTNLSSGGGVANIQANSSEWVKQ